VGFAHAAHVELIKKFWGLGYDIYIWSKTGKEWAEAVARKLGLRKYVTSYLTKPDYYMDDHPAEQWMLQRVYIDPETGKQK
jgi:phosphoserine phosphatase